MATVATPTPTCKALIDDLYGTIAQPEATSQVQPEPLPEAAFSLTIKGTIGGHEAMLTVRGQTAQAFAANVVAVRGLLDQQTPSPTPAPTPVPTATAETPEGWCALHNVQMRKNTKDGRSWWSHKHGDTWCKGR